MEKELIKFDISSVTLDEYKAIRFGEIDTKTGGLISSGFVHDSKTFSLSFNAQANWHTLKNQKAEFTFPKDVTTKNNDTYSLADVDVDSFWDAGKAVIEGHLTSGRDLKKSIFDAVDKDAVAAIIDNR